MKVRNIVALVLVLISYVILVPGLTWPLMTITVSFNFMGNNIEVYDQTRSIVQSIKDLHESGNDFVAGLILLFGILVPLVKGVLLGAVAIVPGKVWRWRLFAFVRSISKWAMADVFAMGVWVAFLAGKAADNIDAQIKVGFYYFVAYCLVSLLALQFMSVPDPSSRALADE